MDFSTSDLPPRELERLVANSPQPSPLVTRHLDHGVSESVSVDAAMDSNSSRDADVPVELNCIQVRGLNRLATDSSKLEFQGESKADQRTVYRAYCAERVPASSTSDPVDALTSLLSTASTAPHVSSNEYSKNKQQLQGPLDQRVETHGFHFKEDAVEPEHDPTPLPRAAHESDWPRDVSVSSLPTSLSSGLRDSQAHGQLNVHSSENIDQSETTGNEQHPSSANLLFYQDCKTASYETNISTQNLPATPDLKAVLAQTDESLGTLSSHLESNGSELDQYERPQWTEQLLAIFFDELLRNRFNNIDWEDQDAAGAAFPRSSHDPWRSSYHGFHEQIQIFDALFNAELNMIAEDDPQLPHGIDWTSLQLAPTDQVYPLEADLAEPEIPIEIRPPCMFYQVGRCAMNDNCPYLHCTMEDQSDLICAICFESPFNTPTKRFGLLLRCDHTFCYECIMKWRKGPSANSSELMSMRSCPVCRNYSNCIIPHPIFVTGEEKELLQKWYFTKCSSTKCKYGSRCGLRNRGCIYNHDEDFQVQDPHRSVDSQIPGAPQQNAQRGNACRGQDQNSTGVGRTPRNQNEVHRDRQLPTTSVQANHQQTRPQFLRNWVNQDLRQANSVEPPTPVVNRAQTRGYRSSSRHSNHGRPGFYQSRNYRLYLDLLQDEEESMDEQEKLNRLLDEVAEDFRQAEIRRFEDANGLGRNSAQKKQIEQQYEESLIMARYGPDEEEEEGEEPSRDCYCIRCLQEQRANYELQLLAALHPKADWDLSENEEPEVEAGPSRTPTNNKEQEKRTRRKTKANQRRMASRGENADMQNTRGQNQKSQKDSVRAHAAGITRDGQGSGTIANSEENLRSDQGRGGSDPRHGVSRDACDRREPSLQILKPGPPKRQQGRNQKWKQSARSSNQMVVHVEPSGSRSEKPRDQPESSAPDASAKASKPEKAHRAYSRKARKGVSEGEDLGTGSIDKDMSAI